MISSQTGIGMRIDNRSFDSRRRSGQSHHRFNNHGLPKGSSRNGAFRGLNGQNRTTYYYDFLIKDDNCGSFLCSNTFERNVHHSPLRYRSKKVIYIRRGLLQILSYRPRQRTKDRFVTGQGAPCFHIDKPGLTHVLYHDIDSGDQEPVVSRPYRYDRVKQRIIEYHIQKMLKKGTVWPMQSQYTSTVVLTCHNYFLPPHYPEAYRFVIDYRKLNAITKFPRYSLPLIEELILNINFMAIMSTLDLRSGVEPNFQKSIDIILNPVLGRFVSVYMDDVIIMSVSFTEHVNHLNQEPLQRTRMTTGGVEEYEDRQPTTEQAQEKEPQCGSIRDGDPADRST
ncbi:retrovirus-related Pol polyprotein from transposon 17.6 [Trichonephila clavipes]|nr:retrovirus-related Pol polyprotein from transposon 17.6 [Trichonephila clavipes]